eukprot:1865967-Ditylum_brightwellii.AAC.1
MDAIITMEIVVANDLTFVVISVGEKGMEDGATTTAVAAAAIRASGSREQEVDGVIREEEEEEWTMNFVMVDCVFP